MKAAPTRPPKMGRELLASLLLRMRTAFYPETLGASTADAAIFFRDKKLLQQAATWPAKFIRENGTGEFDAARYEAIFEALIADVKIHAPAPEQMRRRGAYLLHCVQDHWRHHADRYLAESKTAARAVEREIAGLTKRGETQAAAALPRAVTLLAAANDLLARRPSAKSKKLVEAKPARETQAELF